MGRWIALLILAGVLGGATLLPIPATNSLAEQVTPVPPPVTITNELLVEAEPVAVSDAVLGLRRVTIMPGSAIPVHHHAGTQISTIVQGTLTYTVLSGEVEWFRASEPNAGPTLIRAGETVHLLAGDTLIENPEAIHQGGNDGEIPVVIYLSTLFPAGAPAAVLEATPAP